MTADGVLLHGHQDPFHVLNALVHLGVSDIQGPLIRTLQNTCIPSNQPFRTPSRGPLTRRNSHLIAAEHQLGKLDVVAFEVVVDLGPIVLVNLVIHHGHAAAQWLVPGFQNGVEYWPKMFNNSPKRRLLYINWGSGTHQRAGGSPGPRPCEQS